MIPAALTLLGFWAVLEVIRIRRERRERDREIARRFRLYEGTL
jgi:hypothetical protein